MKMSYYDRNATGRWTRITTGFELTYAKLLRARKILENSTRGGGEIIGQDKTPRSPNLYDLALMRGQQQWKPTTAEKFAMVRAQLNQQPGALWGSK